MPDRLERLDWAERWLGDGFRVIETPGGFGTLDIDMTRASALVDRLRARGLKATPNHLFVRACALALARHPDLHQLVAGNRRLYPERVDIGLSVAGKTSFAPVMVIEDAARKNVVAIAEEVVRRVPEVRAKEEKDLANMRRWGWLIPWGRLRRWLLRWLMGKLWFRRKLAGTFQLSVSHMMDVTVPFLFNSAGAAGMGRVREAVVPVGGQPAVRKIVTMSCSVDHKVWDGMRLWRFMDEVKKVLEEGELDGEMS
jgi:pyruvate/2-oxoglutarate dehydrogenase complex dihydrolipoamide acyltransferase (E2) component